MSAEAIITVSATVVVLTQMCKWGRIVQDSQGPYAVLVLALLGVVLWGVSNETAFARALIWPYFAGWVAVATSAAGVFGFTRAMSDSVTATKTPPVGAAQNPTVPSAPPRG